MLKAENIHFAYGKKNVLQGVNLSVKTGSIHGLVGMNGSGKTTFLRLIAGQHHAGSGGITWQGKPCTPSRIAYMETHPVFFSRTKGREYLELFRLSNPAFNPERWNNLFGLPLEELIESYSTGMKRKLAFMAMIALGKDLLLLDEPFNGLDMDGVEKMKEVIKMLAENGKTIIITSHILESLISISENISLLENGRLERHYSRSEFSEMEEEIRQKVQNEVRAYIGELD